jgi:uncharacterized protein YdhG (YjbR/CyaY superfamily)
MKPNTKFQTVDEYFTSLPSRSKKILKEVRKTIKQAVPKAEEVISYNMPAFKMNGILVWFAVHTEHVGFYPRPSAIFAFAKELEGYKMSKGAIQFPLDEPMPLKLISKIVKFRLKEDKK